RATLRCGLGNTSRKSTVCAATSAAISSGLVALRHDSAPSHTFSLRTVRHAASRAHAISFEPHLLTASTIALCDELSTAERRFSAPGRSASTAGTTSALWGGGPPKSCAMRRHHAMQNNRVLRFFSRRALLCRYGRQSFAVCHFVARIEHPRRLAQAYQA